MSAHSEKRVDVYTRVTNQILAELENGVLPWRKPWNSTNAIGCIIRPLRHNGVPYTGINILMLWATAVDGGFSLPTWMTFRQALELGAHVRKGEKGSLVVYANTLTRTEQSDRGEDVDREIPYLKSYTVFNVAQIDGLPDTYYAPPAPPPLAPVRIAHAEAFFAGTKAVVRHGGVRAFYSPAADHIAMPPYEAFRSPEAYYAVLGHETVHWTGHRSRLDRDLTGAKKTESYAREELVAELGAAFLCADLNLVPAVREDHAPYIASWIRVLKDDKRAVFQAARHAQRAADYLHGLQPADDAAAA